MSVQGLSRASGRGLGGGGEKHEMIETREVVMVVAKGATEWVRFSLP